MAPARTEAERVQRPEEQERLGKEERESDRDEREKQEKDQGGKEKDYAMHERLDQLADQSPNSSPRAP